MIISLQEFVMGIKEMPRLARFIPKIMLAITVTACDEVYRKIACWLNDMGESQPSRFIQYTSTFRAYPAQNPFWCWKTLLIFSFLLLLFQVSLYIKLQCGEVQLVQ